MGTLKPNAERMQLAVKFVTEHPGASMRSVTFHVLESFDEDKREKPTAYKQAASVVERIIKDRHVRQGPDLSLHPWDAKRKTYAEALERAAFAAPTPRERAMVMEIACQAWCSAGDEARARTLKNINERPCTAEPAEPAKSEAIVSRTHDTA